MPEDRKPRTVRSPEQRASDEFEKAKIRLKKAKNRVESIRATLADAEKDVARAQRALDYAASNPDLPGQPVADDQPNFDVGR